MACGCNGGGGASVKYQWSNGQQSRTYNTEVEAQTRKNRDGGSYKPVAG